MNDGIYYVYLKAILFLETNEIFYNVVDTLEKSTDDFFTEIDKELNLNQKSTKDYTVVNLFCILGKPNMVRAAKEKIVTMIQKNTKKFINGSKFKIDVEHGQMLERFTNIYNQYIFENKLCPNTCEFNQGAYFCECFYGTKNYIYQTPDYVLQVFDTWFQKELPLLAGKQMINQSFLFKDFVGRKALELISSVEDNCYYLVFEGNRKIKLAYDNIGTLNMNDLNEFVVNDIQSILYNPIYYFSFTFEPYEIFLEWFDVFLYGMSVLNIDLKDKTSLKRVYEKFLNFIEKHVCDKLEADSPMFDDKNEFYELLAIHINTIRKCLIANDEEHMILKNLLIRMKSRWIYLEEIFNIIKDVYPDAIKDRFMKTAFDICE